VEFQDHLLWLPNLYSIKKMNPKVENPGHVNLRMWWLSGPFVVAGKSLPKQEG
jgi:hypothetical protein